MLRMYSLVITEDDDIIREGLVSFINSADLGFKVVASFDDGEETIEYLGKNETDVVLTDIKMLKVSGIEVAEYVFKNKLSTKVIFISAYEEFEFAQKALENGVEYYFVKPVDLEEICSCFYELKQKLDDEKIIKNKLEEYDEHLLCLQNNFIEDIISGKQRNVLEIKQKASQMRLGIDFDTTVPCVISLTFDEYDCRLWEYGAADFLIMIKNCLQMNNGESLNCFQVIELKNEIEFLILFQHISCTCDVKSYVQKKILDMLNRIKTFFKKQIDISVKFIGDNFFDILNYLENEEHETAPQSEDRIIKSSFDYIENNYYKDISLDDVAGHVFLSSVYFSRYFKQRTGENFTDYLIKVRMEKAITLLKQNKYKIYEVGEKVGYRNSKYFQKLFKEYTGYTPKTYCRSILNVCDDDEV